MKMDLYGIVQCGSVKKARAYLAAHHVDYTFYDFKKEPPSIDWLHQLSQQVAWTELLNKRGQTWRKLTPEQQASAHNQDSALALMLAFPSLIKRPVLVCKETVLVGFDEAAYQALIQRIKAA